MKKTSQIDRDEERRKVTALFDKIDENGKPYSRNRIMKETGVSGRQVTKIAQEAGYKFDRSSPALQAMKKAYEFDAAANRAKVSRQVIEEIQLVLKKMHSPGIIIGWHQGKPVEHQVDAPTATDYKNYATVLGILIDKHLALERFGNETDTGDQTLIRVQMATEVARIIKGHPDISIDEVVNEIVNRSEEND